MGYPMAGHLAAAGHDVRVFNRTASVSKAWTAEHGGHACETPAVAAQGAAIVMICVGADDDVRSVVYGDNGCLTALEAGAVIVDHTTASAALAHELDQACTEKGVGFVDAPVSGGQAGAQNAKLSVMCGGTDADFEVITAVMDAYAATMTLVGPAGAGQQTKMVNQILCAGAIQGAAEALAFAQLAGLDTDKVLAAVTQGAAGSWYLSNRGQTMVDDEFDFGFAVDWLAKDLGIVSAEAERLGADTPLTALTDEYLRKSQAQGDNRMDATTIIRQYPRDPRPDSV